MKDNSSKSNYREDIDGLRAFAIIAVLINHLNEDLLPSGFLGVDVFFVISGFVISLSLDGKKFDSFKSFFLNFFEKRIKRLLPAALVFVLFTGIATILVNPSPGLSLKTGITSLVGLSNIVLYNSF